MAHKKAGSSSKNGRDSVGQRLGVKAGDGQLVPAGSIIVRQRGMTFLAGPGTGLGRDYTVFATVTGRVQFEHATPRQEAHPHRGRGARRADGEQGTRMKTDTHPKYHEAQVTCASCHTEFTVGSTQPGAARRHLLELPPVLHRQADHRGHRRPGRALPEAPRALREALTLSPSTTGPTRASAGRLGGMGATDMARFAYGGQALMEGVLMRGRERHRRRRARAGRPDLRRPGAAQQHPPPQPLRARPVLPGRRRALRDARHRHQVADALRLAGGGRRGRGASGGRARRH